MGKCENCGEKVDDKYKYCLRCVNKYKKENPKGTPTDNSTDNSDVCERLDKIADTLEKMNWNFGMLVATIRKDPKLVKKLIEDEK